MRWIMVLGVAVQLVTGCGGGGTVGAGDDTDACGGYVEYESLQEPVPTDGAAVISFAEAFLRIARRVDLDERVTDRNDNPLAPTAEVSQAYDIMERSMKRLRDRVRQVEGDPAAIGAAVAELTDDEAFAAADRTVATFYAERCSREAYPRD